MLCRICTVQIQTQETCPRSCRSCWLSPGNMSYRSYRSGNRSALIDLDHAVKKSIIYPMCVKHSRKNEEKPLKQKKETSTYEQSLTPFLYLWYVLRFYSERRQGWGWGGVISICFKTASNSWRQSNLEWVWDDACSTLLRGDHSKY